MAGEIPPGMKGTKYTRWEHLLFISAVVGLLLVLALGSLEIARVCVWLSEHKYICQESEEK